MDWVGQSIWIGKPVPHATRVFEVVRDMKVENSEKHTLIHAHIQKVGKAQETSIIYRLLV
jgi:pyruvate formate-lyase activating enzyme-like uncharacterized protein